MSKDYSLASLVNEKIDKPLKRVIIPYINSDQLPEPGDLVIIRKGFWGTPDHYVGKSAVVEYRYCDKYGTDNKNSLSLNVEGMGSSAWWDASQLQLLQRDTLPLLEQWFKRRKVRTKKFSSLKFVVTHLIKHNGDVEKLPRASIKFLWNLIFPGEPMGGMRGEGMIAYQNTQHLLIMINIFTKIHKSKFTKTNKRFLYQALLTHLKITRQAFNKDFQRQEV